MSSLKKARIGLNTTYEDVMSPSLRARKTITFTGAAGLGAIGAATLFTITGKVIVDRIIATCTGSLTGATATIALGVTSSTSLFIAATTATGITNGAIWASTSPNANGIALPAALQNIAIAQNILATIATANVTGGTLVIDVYFTPITDDGLLTAA